MNTNANYNNTFRSSYYNDRLVKCQGTANRIQQLPVPLRDAVSVVWIDHEQFGDEIESGWIARAIELYRICWGTNNKQAVINK